MSNLEKQFKKTFGYKRRDIEPPIPSQRAWDMINHGSSTDNSQLFAQINYSYAAVEVGSGRDPYVLIQRTTPDGQTQYAYIFDTNNSDIALLQAPQLHGYEWGDSD